MLLIYSCLILLVSSKQQFDLNSQATNVQMPKLTSPNDCQVKEPCRRCNFTELKENSECEETGYKLTQICKVQSNKKLIELVQSLSCSQVEWINPMTSFFLFNLLLLVGSTYYLYRAKSMIFKHAMGKLMTKIK